jgi:hypothetical protein
VQNLSFNFFSQKISNFSVTFLIASMLALLAGCGSGVATTPGGGTTTATPTLALQLYDANGAVTTLISPDATATVRAILKDAAGAPVVGAVVTFNVTDATLATISQTTALTDSNGVAGVSPTVIVSATGAAGATSITASASVTTSGTTATATGATSFAVVSGGASQTPTLTLQLTNSAGTAITSISPTVQGTVKATVKDTSGTVVPNSVVTFSVTDTALATISQTTALTDSNGVASVKVNAKAPGATSITASTEMGGVPASSSLNFSVTTNTPSLTLSLTSTIISASSPATVRATLKDGTGAVMAGTTVTFSVANATLATVAPTSISTDAFGVATVTLSAGTGAGATTITATAPVTDPLNNNQVTSSPANFSVLSTDVTVASLSLSANPTTVKSDNSTSTTITVTALSAANAATPDVVVSLSADTGIISTNTVTTDATGKATFTFSSGTASKTNRTANITATAGVMAQLPVSIVGSTLTVNASGTTVPDDGSSTVTLTFTAKDAGGIPVSGTSLVITSRPSGVDLSPACTAAAPCTMDANGQKVITVTGAAIDSGSVIGAALGATASSPITVTSLANTFAITKTRLNAALPISDPTSASMKIGDDLVVVVNAPSPTTDVEFTTTMGLWWDGASGVPQLSVPVPLGGMTCGLVTTAANQVCATLNTDVAGLANVEVYDQAELGTSDTLTVSMTATNPYKITLQASPSLVGKCVGTTCPFSTLTATVTDSNNLPVGDEQIAFSIVNPTGGGENVSPVVGLTTTVAGGGLSLGQARTTFTSGSQSSSAPGVKIRAQVLGTTVVTNTSPSGNDAAIVIGGTAGSIAFGQATTLGETANGSAYVSDMSVLVTDSNGNPAPAGTVVNLSVWPIAWSTGTQVACAVDSDTATTGTFRNEDINENLFLGPFEDGVRIYYYQSGALPGGTIDGYITPVNSAGGVVPGSVTTDATGLATFTLTYPKTSAIWTVTRLRAQTVVQGSAAVSEYRFPLWALKKDVDPDCLLSSPYRF